MQIRHGQFATKALIRCSLSRGLARQALDHAAVVEADVAALVLLASTVRPNAKAMLRLAAQLAGKRGVVRAGVGGGGVVIVARNLCTIRTQVGAQDIFAERSLVYTRLAIRAAQGRARFHVTRAGFSLHALERLVERSAVALDAPLLAAADCEAVHLLRGLSQSRDFGDGEDRFVPAVAQGVWAGSPDHAGLDADWGLVAAEQGEGVPFFSVRTFLGEDEMRPTVWLAWKNGGGTGL